MEPEVEIGFDEAWAAATHFDRRVSEPNSVWIHVPRPGLVEAAVTTEKRAEEDFYIAGTDKSFGLGNNIRIADESPEELAIRRMQRAMTDSDYEDGFPCGSGRAPQTTTS